MEVKEMADLKRKLKGKRAHLTSLLKKPLFPKNFSGKFLDTSLELSLGQNSEKAIDVMKKAIDDYPNLKKKKLSVIPKKKNIASKKQVGKERKKREKKLK